jgi:hypothetical protein
METWIGEHRMTARELKRQLSAIPDEKLDLPVYTTNTDAPGENYGYVYSGAKVGGDPEDREKEVVWIR